MKVFKNITCFLIALFSLFLSCKQKDSGPSVFGQWQVVSFDFDSTSSMYKEMSAEDRDDTKRIATGFAFDFKKDNSFVITHNQEENSKGIFKITGNNEIMMSPERDTPQTCQVLQLDEKTIVLKDPKRGYIFTLKKI